MNAKRNKNLMTLLWILVALLVIMLVMIVAVVAVILIQPGDDPAVSTQPSQSIQTVTEPTEEFTVSPETIPVSDGEDAVELEDGLRVHSFNSYTGLYMEDGSDEMLSRVAMVILTNDSANDLQYARVTVTYADEVCTYTVTNLPAGASAVLLEQNRKALPEGEPVSTLVDDVVFFQEPMDTCSEIFEISGMDGVMNVKNISNTDIDGMIYVYYKYSSADLFYGGITFRISIPNGLGAGEISQNVTAHFDPARCTIVDIDYDAS